MKIQSNKGAVFRVTLRRKLLLVIFSCSCRNKKYINSSSILRYKPVLDNDWIALQRKTNQLYKKVHFKQLIAVCFELCMFVLVVCDKHIALQTENLPHKMCNTACANGYNTSANTSVQYIEVLLQRIKKGRECDTVEQHCCNFLTFIICIIFFVSKYNKKNMNVSELQQIYNGISLKYFCVLKFRKTK